MDRYIDRCCGAGATATPERVLPAPATGVNAAAVESVRRFGGPGTKKKESGEAIQGI